MGCDFACERAEGADRRAEDDKVRAPHGIGGVLADLIGELKPADGGPRCFGARGRGDRPREVCPPHRMAQGRANQADADQRHFLKHRFFHRSTAPASGSPYKRLTLRKEWSSRRQLPEDDPPQPPLSWPRMTRPSSNILSAFTFIVDGPVKPGHDNWVSCKRTVLSQAPARG